MQRPDLRQIAGNIREALADSDRDTLLDMLTFVFKEYVVEGPPPLLISQAERVPDLEGLSFAELIRTLQTRLDLPELNLFQVDGAQVMVRVNGVLTPLDAGAARAQAMVQAASGSMPVAAGAPAPAAQPAQQQQPPPPRAGVQVVETTFTRVPARVSAPEPGAPAGAGAPAGQAPPPRRGLSVRGQPGGEDAPSARPTSAPAGREAQPGSAQPQQQQASQPAGQPSQPSQPSGQQQSGEAPRSDRDIAAERFSLLELD